MKISLVIALVGTLGCGVWAQPKPVPAPAMLEQPNARTYSIPIRNVKPSWIAWWLDPTNHEMPTELKQIAPEETRNVPLNKGAFQLPAGVTRIVAVDPQNALLVFGTPEGVNQLRSTIAFMDRPLRQVEIEAQFVSIQTSAAKQFGLDFSPVRGNFNASTAAGAVPDGGLQLGFVRGNFAAAIAAAENSGRAKTLTIPRVVAINNLTASLSQSTSTPVEIGVRDAAGTLRPLENGNFIEGAPLLLTSVLKFKVTPTINNDDTVTLLMNIGSTRHLVTNGGADTNAATAPASPKDLSLKTIVNVRDGETIALGSALPAQKDTTIVVFVTARIIRRVGEGDGVHPAARQ